MDAREAVLSLSAGNAAATEALESGEAVETGDLDTTEGERLTQVVDGEVIDVAHAGLETATDTEGAVGIVREDVGTETVGAVVDDFDGLIVSDELHANHDGAEDFVLCDRHSGLDVGEDCGRVEGSLRFGPVTTDDEAGTSLDGLVDELLDASTLTGTHGHGTKAADILIILDRSRALIHLGDVFLGLFDDFFVDALLDDDTLNTDTVLAAVLEGATHDDGHDALKVGILADDSGILATEFENDRGESLGGLFHDELADSGGSDKGQLVGHFDQSGAGVGEASDEADEVGAVAVLDESFLDDLFVVLSGVEGRELRNLSDEGIASEQGGDHGSDNVVEGIVPGNDGRNDTEGNVAEDGLFVSSDQANVAVFVSEGVLTFENSPRELLTSSDDLTKGTIEESLAALDGASFTKGAVVFDDVVEDGVEDTAAFAE